ncbi:NAD-glutamate dehydrogenase [Lipingzhangella sp. LS1_29]|uniref:NAD-glutamate dehydrogenase n=1 Tax=Lipingzhangella rawalii TaxID=2055835 RepID=A0ABU2HB60_9ACTN|nr:NAD-glutamate dehydrogenase [Lipingzhangella rawalii]MDS1272558.1 NAD-glutamate dehydrogenase [Lipingzhangella rawalii]
MHGQSSSENDQLVREALARWRREQPQAADAPQVPEGKDDAWAEWFLCRYYRNVPVDQLRRRGDAEICGPALGHLRLAQTRPQGRANLRLYTPDRDTDGWDNGCSVVEIVTDDAEFLVRSVKNALSRNGVGVRLVIHPQLRVERDLLGELRAVEPSGSTATGMEPLDESWIHIEVDRQTDPTVLKDVERVLSGVLADVRQVDEDQDRMEQRAREIATELASGDRGLSVSGVDSTEVSESVEFLDWMAARNFIFLGYREYDLVSVPEGQNADADADADTDADTDTDAAAAELRLTPVVGTGLGLLRGHKSHSKSFEALSPQARTRARDAHLLVLSKANSPSTVQEDRYLDYIGVKRFDDSGAVIGERRFLGLFAAGTTSIAHIPILRRKLDRVLEMSGVRADSYDGRYLVEVLEDLPREELFQASEQWLLDVARGVLGTRESPGTKLFLRREIDGRYVSCLVYMPRDQFNTQVREAVRDTLKRKLGGASAEYRVSVTESSLARLYVVVRGEAGNGTTALPETDPVELEAAVVAAARSWDLELQRKLAEAYGPDRGAILFRAYGQALPDGYKADVSVDTAITDLARIDELGEDALAGRLYQPSGARPDEWRFKVYRTGSPLALSTVLPFLEHMGLEVIDERPYGIKQSGGRLWIYDFGLGKLPVTDGPPNRSQFEDAFHALWHGYGESDEFNNLVVSADLSWRQVTVLRAYAKYLRQTGSTFSPSYYADVLRRNARIARLLVTLFEARFDPRHEVGRSDVCDGITEEIHGELDQVASLDEDRILRAFLAAIEASLRTNYYQHDPDSPSATGKPYLVLKLDPRAIPDLPEPRPRYEMFVYSPRMEGVHLRFGAIARGGLRWSDRPEDFRTEILGLVKAQVVKNAIIVPSGAKGGFVCKRLPTAGDRDAVQTEVVACYEQFIRGLLDVTDNLVDGQIVHPDRVVRHDDTDSYLVVAADKGTATFSDIANRIAAERGFWLGDAFASGGSVGYDHKAMGITAKGAWESVKYHFRGMGIDVQTEEFTVVGIGDMSGDVFGNGMLLSDRIRLVAAFDHRHIFLDPTPDAATSYTERARLFALPRSSWADYDTSLISAGGGVHPRSAKSIPVTPQVRTALGMPEDITSLTPFELISYILCAPVDLLWNGGIGTYIKASSETHADVGDKGNDALRVDAADLRCRVIGEGGNLGVTQAGRIEFALAGGLVNTDFIDNSAGVDTSDHEVNIKIMLDREVDAGALTKPERDQLFRDMTDEVAELVLRDNYDQNVVIAASGTQSASLLHVHERYIKALERQGMLDRTLECLPDKRALAARRSAGQGLTAPEFATLLSYTKIALEEEISESDLPGDPYLRDTLVEYFPTPLREQFGHVMDDHPLWRGIITTSVVNDLVNSMGSTFVFRINEETGASATDITRAYLVVREVFGLRELWREVEALDHKVPLHLQLRMLLEARKLAERASRWLLRRRGSSFKLGDEIEHFRPRVAEIIPMLPGLLRGVDAAAYENRADSFTAPAPESVPTSLVQWISSMVPAFSTFDLVQVGQETGRPLREVADVYFYIADQLGISRLRGHIIDLPRDDRWNTMARSAVRDELYEVHAALTRDVLRSRDPGASPQDLLHEWQQRNAAAFTRSTQTMQELEEAQRYDLATLSVALRSVRSLVA